MFTLSLSFTFQKLEAQVSYQQSYSQGYKKYQNQDFVGAEYSFKAALALTGNSAEKARIYKMLGIIQYMQGKRIDSRDSFENARKYSPYINISPSEVTDKSVIAFFQSIVKDRALNNPETVKREKTEEITTLTIFTNASHSRIIIDQRYIVKSGEGVRIPSGKHSVEITAEGYEKSEFTIDIKKDVANNLNINLRPSSSVQKEADTKKITEKKSVKKNSKPKKKYSRRKPNNKNAPVKNVKNNSYENASTPSKMMSTPFLIAPFGIGHFAMGDVGTGIIYGGGQVIALTLGVMQWFNGEAVIQDANRYVGDRDQMVNDGDFGGKTPSEFEDETNQTTAEFQKSADSYYMQSYIFNGLFAALWIASTIHGFSKNSSYKSAGIYSSDQKHSLLGMNNHKSRFEADEPQLQWSLTPLRKPVSKDRTLYSGLFLKLNF